MVKRLQQMATALPQARLLYLLSALLTGLYRQSPHKLLLKRRQALVKSKHCRRMISSLSVTRLETLVLVRRQAVRAEMIVSV